jgi:hypothetical protein
MMRLRSEECGVGHLGRLNADESVNRAPLDLDLGRISLEAQPVPHKITYKPKAAIRCGAVLDIAGAARLGVLSRGEAAQCLRDRLGRHGAEEAMQRAV